MDEPHIFVLADRALNDVVAQIKDDQWLTPMPANFATRLTDHSPTQREIINDHAYDDWWVPDMLAGRRVAEVGQDKFKRDLLGDDSKGNFAAIVDRACAAVQRLDDLERTVHCSFGDYPAREYLWQVSGFRGLR
ncbi:MAG: hypothetical protein LC797_24620 [Chloroflexi bacterium]|nr:hypothetical protein [Chloroflexota bacterium]